MVGDRAYLVTRGPRKRLPAATASTRRRRWRRAAVRPGQHRLGSSPTLCHCRDMPVVRARLAARRTTGPGNRPPGRRRAAPRKRVPHSAVLMLLLASLTLVSAWFVATGAVAFAGMIAR
ncbi:MAG: hypothetical protein V7603_692 [Micromonosporaceae bacterium]